jgi:hypothetical protein
MGRNTKFSDALGSKISELYKQGKTDREVAKLVGVSRTSLHYWKLKYPEFLNTVKEAKDVADDYVEACLFSRATGYNYTGEKQYFFEGRLTRVPVPMHSPPDVAACIFWLKNRRPEIWRDAKVLELPPALTKPKTEKSFSEFCETAGYPAPFPKQVEMTTFGISLKDARLLLGSRGYGKTDYVVILGIAYDLYLNPMTSTNLIITKSKERNAAILREINNACTLNGMSFEKANSNFLRLTGLQGKDHSVSAVTIKTVTLRGRHPKRVVMDDPVTEDDASEATRAHVERVYNEVNKLCGNILIIGQPAHKYDLYAKLRGIIKTMEVPHGTIPELDHDLEAQRLAGVDEASISASYYLKVLSEGTSPFDKVKYMERFPTGDSSVAFIDPSFEGGDFTAISILKQHMQGVAVVGFTFKKAWNHCLDEMVPHLKKFNVRKVCFETNNLGTMPLDLLRNLFGSEIGVIGRKSNTNKHARIMAAGTYAHLIHLSKESDKTYIDQVVKYEYKAKNDDAPDSLASCLEWIGLIRGKI